MTNIRKINIISRAGLAFIYFYHGLFPKILGLSQTEKELVSLHELNMPVEMVSTVAGILEIILAMMIIFLRQTLLPVYIAAFLLAALLIDVAIIKPSLLAEAFNPVSTNISGLMLCYIIFLSQKSHNIKNSD